MLWVSPKCKNTITRHCGVANEHSRFPKNSFPKILRSSKRCEVVNFWQKEKKWKSISWFKALDRTLNVGKTV